MSGCLTGARFGVRANAPMPAHRAAIFAAELAEQVARRHAGARAQGRLDVSTRVENDRPVLGEPAGGGTAPDDVRQIGELLAQLLGARIDHPRPHAVPERIWSLILACLDRDPGARPTAGALAQQLREAARDLLLGVEHWPAASTPPGYVPSADDEIDQPAGQDAGPRGRGRQRTIIIVAAAAVAVLLAGGFLINGLLGGEDAGGGGQVQASPSPSPSQAASAGPPVEACLPPDCAAKATFQPFGELFSVCDGKSDGLAAVVVYTRADQPGEKFVWASSGYGSCVEANLEIAEGTDVTFKVCTGDRPKNQITRCGEPVTVKA